MSRRSCDAVCKVEKGVHGKPTMYRHNWHRVKHLQAHSLVSQTAMNITLSKITDGLVQ